MDDFLRAGFKVFWCIFSFSVCATETHEQWPFTLTKANQTIVKVVNGDRIATGFTVKNNSGEVFVATNLHAVYNLIEKPDTLQDFQLINTEGQLLSFQGLETFAIFPDLALIKLADYKGPALLLAPFDEVIQDAYILGFPYGRFKRIKIWSLRSTGKISLDGITYSREMPGSSGAPLFNDRGFVIGILVGGDFQHSVFFSRSSSLRRLLAKTGKNSPEGILKEQLTEELNFLVALAEKGDVEVQSRLGQLYKDEEFLFHNLEESRKWTMRAAENGDARSQISMAEFHMENKAYTKGGRLIKRAARQRYPQAMYYVSEFYRTGANGFPKNPRKHLTWLIRAMETNHPEAINRMATMSLTGVGVPQNVGFGLRLFHILSERDFSSLKEILLESGISFNESAFWSELTESGEESLPEILQDFPGIRACVPSLFGKSGSGSG